ncbi:MAG: enoyl-CoA hydratase/isomerase family protein [Pyrinomonadaceae bacterium]
MTEGAETQAHKQADVTVETHAGLAVVRLSRPAERNALSSATLDALDEAVSLLKSSSHIFAVIFTGTDDVFASGANIRELRLFTPSQALDFARRGQRLFRKITDTPKLTIAAVNGYCMGGGLDLALACDIRCASPGTVFAHPGVRLGIITGWGGTQRLPRLIGAARALEIFATARRVTCTEAYEIGMVDHVADSAFDCALQIVRARTLRSASHTPAP